MAFITEIAEYINKNYDLSKESLTIIFPNKRAAMKLRLELMSHNYKNNIWLPQILSIQEAMSSWSGFQLLDNIDITFKLINIINANNVLSNDTYGLASQMLKDFDEIDQYAVDAKSLFQNTKEAKEIDLHFIDENYSIDKKYLEFFASLNDYYETLRNELIKDNTGYYGLISRYICENIEEIEKNIGNRKIIFAGFNAMTKTEEGIIVKLIQDGKAVLLWDLDEYYFNDKRQEAGIFAREFFERNKNLATKEMNFLGKRLLNDTKKINIIGASGATIQTNALQLELNKEKSNDRSNEVIVLADESLLIPVLNCIPNNIDKLHVTMGFPYSKTMLNQFLLHLFAFQKNIRDNEKGIYFWSLSRLLGSELIKIIFDNEELKCLYNWKNEQIKKSTYYISLDDYKCLDNYPYLYDFLCIISEKWNSTIKCVSSIKQLLKSFYAKIKGQDNTNFINNQISVAGRIINKIEQLIKKYNQIIQITDIETLYRQSSSEMTINLTGSYSGLQIMGLLETRNLDFKTIHILSVNEGVLPQSKSSNSLIPFDLRKYYQLPTYNNKQAVYAYHFYRLLQDAENINIYYNTLADGMGEGEASRFIKQIIHEMPSKNPNVEIKEKTYKSPIVNNSETKELQVVKTDEIYEKIVNKLSFVSEDKISGLSPTSISTYLTCTLKFYLKYIAKIQDSTPNELIQSNVIGTIIHATFENFYKYFEDKEVTLDIYKDYQTKYFEKARQQALSDNNFPNGLPDTGFNYLNSKIMDKLIKNFIEHEINFLEENNLFKIIGLEKELHTNFNIPKHNIKVNLIGNADRIDQVGNMVRIIDYKTGSIKDSDVVIKKSAKDFKDLTEKSLQLLIYKYLYKTSNQNIDLEHITPGIFGLRKISKGLFTLSNKSELFNDDTFMQDCESRFIELFEEILNRDIPFKQTDNEKECLNCDFIEICKRNPKTNF